MNDTPIETEHENVDIVKSLEATNPQVAESTEQPNKKISCRMVEGIEDKDSDEDNASLSEIEDNSIVSNSQASTEDSNSHTSLCNGLKVLNMKGLVGRPRKKSKSFRNPFDFGCSLKRSLKKKSKYKIHAEQKHPISFY